MIFILKKNTVQCYEKDSLMLLFIRLGIMMLQKKQHNVFFKRFGSWKKILIQSVAYYIGLSPSLKRQTRTLYSKNLKFTSCYFFMWSLYQFLNDSFFLKFLIKIGILTDLIWCVTFCILGFPLSLFMLSPLAPDLIRVQSCVCCLFWTNRNSMAVTSIFLSISLSNQSYESLYRR